MLRKRTCDNPDVAGGGARMVSDKRVGGLGPDNESMEEECFVNDVDVRDVECIGEHRNGKKYDL